jgi:hypothetical protein
VETICGDPVAIAAEAATRRKILSPAGHIRDYSFVLSIRSSSAPEASHKRMSEYHVWCCGGAACRDCRLEHFAIPL